MDIITNLTSYFTNKEIHFPKKVLFVIFIVLGFALINSVFSFSYYFNSSNKIEQLSELNKVLSNNTLNSNETAKLKSLRTEILNHKSLLELDFISFFTIDFEDGRNSWLHFISANTILLFLGFTMLVISFVEIRQGMHIILTILLIFEPLIFLICWIIAKLLAFIPAFNSSWTNYGLNFIISLVLFSLFALLVQKIEKTRLIRKINKGVKSE